MCGIAGVISPSITPDARESALSRMCAAMQHRGPDDAGALSDGDATIGMRRLAIFDPANGHQPMTTPDGRFSIVFNGAVYNFAALRAELHAAGFSFRTNCDTEVLLAAYARWGAKCLDRLRGMFAFAVWDAREKSLFLARDPFGIKPLYFQHQGGRLIFASELNALLASGLVTAEIDPLSVADYLAWFTVPAPRTIYRGIESLRPGECATFRDGRLDVRTGWSFRSIPADTRVCASRAEFTAELRARLEDTIRAHVVADVPVGAFLSGGLDSATVVGLMSRVSGATPRTFSIIFNEAAYSEADHASQTAAHFGARHHASLLTGDRVAADLEGILRAMDQPTGDGINTYYASLAARTGGVTVALSGLGGDELFGGYPSFRDTPRLARMLPLWRLLPKIFRSPIVAQLRARDTRARKLADFLEFARTEHELGALQRRVFSEGSRRALLSPHALSELGRRAPYHPELATLTADLEDSGQFETISAWELRTYMADVLLRDSDVMSMRHSLELRVPFVDRPLIEWLWRQPARFKDDRAQPKSALAAAVADLLPPALLARRKQGFSLPFPLWMRAQLRPFLEETFSTSSVAKSGLFDGAEVQRTWQAFKQGSDNREWSRVWTLGVLVAFANRRAPALAAPAAPPTIEFPPARTTVLFAPEIFASEGGIPRILQTYLKALCDLAPPGDALRLLALNDTTIRPDDVRRVAGGRLESWTTCARNKRRFIGAAMRMCLDADLVICGHVAQLPVALAAQMANPRLRYILIAHGIEVWRKFNLAERTSLRRAERIWCISDFTRKELLANCPGLDPLRTVVLPNALDPWFRIAPGAPRDGRPPVILVVTRLTAFDRYKGVIHMIEAMPAILAARPDAILRIIGRGDDLPFLTRRRDELALGDKVEFTGYVDDQRLEKELRSCALFALPSKKEGFGLVFLEAMANGRPCLGARAGGVPEVITPESGVLVEYGDVPGIAGACVAALGRDWDENAILDRARHFSYENFCHRLAGLLPSA